VDTLITRLEQVAEQVETLAKRFEQTNNLLMQLEEVIKVARKITDLTKESCIKVLVLVFYVHRVYAELLIHLRC
jgi:hypothetical protein